MTLQLLPIQCFLDYSFIDYPVLDYPVVFSKPCVQHDWIIEEALYIVLTVLLVSLSLALQCFLASNDTAMTLYVNEMFMPVRTTWILFADELY